jgi:hypothetical protein
MPLMVSRYPEPVVVDDHDWFVVEHLGQAGQPLGSGHRIAQLPGGLPDVGQQGGGVAELASAHERDHQVHDGLGQAVLRPARPGLEQLVDEFHEAAGLRAHHGGHQALDNGGHRGRHNRPL